MTEQIIPCSRSKSITLRASISSSLQPRCTREGSHRCHTTPSHHNTTAMPSMPHYPRPPQYHRDAIEMSPLGHCDATIMSPRRHHSHIITAYIKVITCNLYRVCNLKHYTGMDTTCLYNQGRSTPIFRPVTFFTLFWRRFGGAAWC